jgi:16S rRNA G966 N2-methylase RsmD
MPCHRWIQCTAVALIALLAGQACSAWQPLQQRRPHRTPMRAKRKKVDRETAWAEKKAREAQDKKRRKGRATDIAPAAVLANGVPIPEDHRFEQFFYDAPTNAKMMRLVRRFEKPLLVCVPSIAAKLDSGGEDYLLLDRDERFATLRHYEPFDLRSPKSVAYAFDALFLDPPFANVTPEELAAAVSELCGGRQVPLFVGYNLNRAAELVDAFGAYDLRDTGDVLGYATGVMEGRISLFTNWRP